MIEAKVLSQGFEINGTVKDENDAPVGYAPVVLLHFNDSTLANFGITDEQGEFKIKGIKSGKYILMVSFIGMQTFRKLIYFPLEENGLISIVLKYNPVPLREVIVSSEYVPLKLRKDTIEFNAAAFSVKPDAVVEDLLKRMPGIEVDRAGNIRALGEDITQVLVNGREFFNNDYKIATRNLQADILKGVQVFDKKSDESEFTGIDDGLRYKTLNLLLKEDKNKTLFGELLIGTGADLRYQGSAKTYKFNSKNQVAALGMINNINQFGFSLKDNIGITGNNGPGDHSQNDQSGVTSSFPVDFGKPVDGISVTGASGLNYSKLYNGNNRIFINLVTNSTDKKFQQVTSDRNYTEESLFDTYDTLSEKKLTRNLRLNFGIKDRIDSTNYLLINWTAAISSTNNTGISDLKALSEGSLCNENSGIRKLRLNNQNSTLDGTYLKLMNKGKTVLKLFSRAILFREPGNVDWENNSRYFNPESDIFNAQVQKNVLKSSLMEVKTSLIQKAGRRLYIEPGIEAGEKIYTLNRIQRDQSAEMLLIDTLSVDFRQYYRWLRPKMGMIYNGKNSQLTLNLKLEAANIMNSLNGDGLIKKMKLYFTPGVRWEYLYKTGRKIRLYYNADLIVPSLSQLLPITDVSNPVILRRGNRNLDPEMVNNLYLNWWVFDQFTFTTFITSLNATYTRDKINWNCSVTDGYGQFNYLINVPEDFQFTSSSFLSTPIKRLGLKLNLSFGETWSRGISIINGFNNISTSQTSMISVGLENRTKTIIDIRSGLNFRLTNAKYSVQKSLNNVYSNFSYYSELRYKPTETINFTVTADITNYNSRSFNSFISIPILGTEVSYFFLKGRRASLLLQGIDLLNKNKGIERISELNYLRERRSNMLGRVIMLSFKYRFQSQSVRN